MLDVLVGFHAGDLGTVLPSDPAIPRAVPLPLRYLPFLLCLCFRCKRRGSKGRMSPQNRALTPGIPNPGCSSTILPARLLTALPLHMGKGKRRRNAAQDPDTPVTAKKLPLYRRHQPPQPCQCYCSSPALCPPVGPLPWAQEPSLDAFTWCWFRQSSVILPTQERSISVRRLTLLLQQRPQKVSGMWVWLSTRAPSGKPIPLPVAWQFNGLARMGDALGTQ